MVFKLVFVVVVVTYIWIFKTGKFWLFVNIALSSQNLRTFVPVIVLADL